jgi:phosphoribosylformylglycinamidine cyclo-ligase
MGIGWVAIVAPDDVEKACAAGAGGIVLGTMRQGDGVHVKVAGE